MIPAASLAVQLGIGGLAAVATALFAWAVLHTARPDAASKRVTRVSLAVASLWLAGASLAALTGLLARFDLRPPPYLLMVIGTFALGIWAGVSPLGGRVAHGVPLAVLVAAQGFRLPLELVMHRAYVEGVMPRQLSYSGFNFDIVTGTGAILLAGLIHAGRAPRALVAGWNLLGFACLAVIAMIAITTSPVLRLFGEGPSNVNYWVAYFPFVLLAAACVTFALAGHIVVLRRLRSA